MTKLSTGHDSTLESYRALSAATFGEDSMATAFLDRKIVASPKGGSEEVLATEEQMVALLGHMALGA